MIKRCTKCKIEKSEKDFVKDKHTKDGFSKWCKNCKKENYSSYRFNKCKCGGDKTKTSNLCWECFKQEYRGEKHHSYKNGRSKDGNGYVIITLNINENNNFRIRVKEHIFVMEQYLNRKLRPGENVHHKNGVRDDNRIENLELWVSSQPSGQRVTDLLDWAYEIIEKYGKEKNRLS